MIHNLPAQKRFKNNAVHIPMATPKSCIAEKNDFNSFLQPIVDDFVGLSKGIYVYDAHLGKKILLKVHLTFVDGDMSAVAKMMSFMDHSDYPCGVYEVKKGKPLTNSSAKGLPANCSWVMRSKETILQYGRIREGL